jgi:LuxR family maltose regulon positive regulatory protein
LLSEFPPEPFPARPSNLPEALTERELDVLRLMADGLRNQEIGEKLYISLNTIRYHTTNIFGKLAVDNRTAAVARARELGIH